MRKALGYFGAQIRPPGENAGVNRKRKLETSEINQILEMDLNNTPHASIARFFNKGGRTISKERIRQICLAAGHETRRSRMIPQIELLRARRLAREQSRLEIAKKVSRAWKEGAGRDELSYLMFGGLRTRWHINSRLGFFRDKYGLRMFPYRIKGHWATLDLKQHEERIRFLSKVWNSTGSVMEIKHQCGYKTYNSASASIQRYRRKYPRLFPSRREILKKRMDLHE